MPDNQDNLDKLLEQYAEDYPTEFNKNKDALSSGDPAAYAKMFGHYPTTSAQTSYAVTEAALKEYVGTLDAGEIQQFYEIATQSSSPTMLAEVNAGITDPVNRAVAEYTVEFYSDDKNAGQPLDFSNTAIFWNTIGDESVKDQKEFIEWLTETNPEQAENLLNALGDSYLPSLEAAAKGTQNDLALPFGLAYQMIEETLENEGDKTDRGTAIRNLVDGATFTGNEEEQAAQERMADALGAYVAYLDDKGELKGKEETIIALANGTAGAEEYAQMFAATDGYGNIFMGQIDAEPLIANYLNNANLSKEDISTFVGAMCRNDQGDLVKNILNEIDDPEGRAIAQYSYAYMNGKLEAGATTASVSLTDPDAFLAAFAGDPKDAQVYLKWLSKEHPEEALELAEKLGVEYLSGLSEALNQANGVQTIVPTYEESTVIFDPANPNNIQVNGLQTFTPTNTNLDVTFDLNDPSNLNASFNTNQPSYGPRFATTQGALFSITGINIDSNALSLSADALATDPTNAELFKKTFENDPKGRDAFLKDLMENDPESAKKLAENLGAGYLRSLCAEVLPYGTTSEYARQLDDPNRLLELATGVSFPTLQPDAPQRDANGTSSGTAPIYSDAPEYVNQWRHENDMDNGGVDSTLGGDDSSVGGTSLDGQGLTLEDLKTLGNDYPLVAAYAEYLEKYPEQMPATGKFDIASFEEKLEAFANSDDPEITKLLGVKADHKYDLQGTAIETETSYSFSNLQLIDCDAGVDPAAPITEKTSQSISVIER